MAKKKKSRPKSIVSKPQNWFLEAGRERAREYQQLQGWSDERVRAYMRLKRVSDIDYLVRTVLGERDEITGKRSGGLRDYFTGFDAKDGYDMRHPENLPWARVKSIRDYGAYLHNLQSAPYIKVSPRSRAMRTALQERTGQHSKRQKRYVYHTDKPSVTKVTYQKGVLLEKQQVTPKTEILRAYYFFRDYNGGRQPRTFKAMERIAEERMLNEMPDRYYSFWTDLHGAIGAPFPKSSLLRELQRYGIQYGSHKGFAEGLLGFVFQGTQDQADSEYVNRLNRRTRREQQKKRESQQRQQQLRFLAQARSGSRKRCEVIGPGGRCRRMKGHRGPHKFGESS